MPRKKGSPGDDSGPTSMFILSADNPIRRHAKHIIELPVFEYAVLVTITANCVVLAMEEHLPGGDRAPLAVQLVSQSPCLSCVLWSYIMGLDFLALVLCKKQFA